MKIKKDRVRQIIKEELQIALDEIDAANRAIAKGTKSTKQNFGSSSKKGSRIRMAGKDGLGPVCGPFVKATVADANPEDTVEFVRTYQNPNSSDENDCWKSLEDALEDHYGLKYIPKETDGFLAKQAGKAKANKNIKKVRKALKKAKFDKTLQQVHQNKEAGKTGRATQIFVKDSSGAEIKDFKAWITKIIA